MAYKAQLDICTVLNINIMFSVERHWLRYWSTNQTDEMGCHQTAQVLYDKTFLAGATQKSIIINCGQSIKKKKKFTGFTEKAAGTCLVSSKLGQRKRETVSHSQAQHIYALMNRILKAPKSVRVQELIPGSPLSLSGCYTIASECWTFGIKEDAISTTTDLQTQSKGFVSKLIQSENRFQKLS